MDFDSFKSETEIIHVLYHHNRNQHRQAKWWKYFSILHRRCIDLVEKWEVYSTNEIEKLATYLVYKITPIAYRYFHGILTTGQFIALGFALIGCLAKIRLLLLPLAKEKKQQIKKIDSNGKDYSRSTSVLDDDLGEVISRIPAESPLILPLNSKEVVEKKIKKKDIKQVEKKVNVLDKTEDIKEKKKNTKKKSKKKKKNAIDDIFGL